MLRLWMRYWKQAHINKLSDSKVKKVKTDKPAGDSSEQREAEKRLLDAFSRKLGVTLTQNKEFKLDGGSRIELDGFCESPLILCEAWAHIGLAKGAQLHKVMADALRLLFVNKVFFEGKGELVLLFADYDAAKRFEGESWRAQCLEKYNIKVKVIELPSKIKAKVQKAQKRQKR